RDDTAPRLEVRHGLAPERSARVPQLAPEVGQRLELLLRHLHRPRRAGPAAAVVAAAGLHVAATKAVRDAAAVVLDRHPTGAVLRAAPTIRARLAIGPIPVDAHSCRSFCAAAIARHSCPRCAITSPRS